MAAWTKRRSGSSQAASDSLSGRLNLAPMKGSLSNLAPALGFAVTGIATAVFGEADDAPGLVLFGLLLIAGAVALWFKPPLATKSRLAAFLVGAVVVTAIGSLVAGWLEETF